MLTHIVAIVILAIPDTAGPAAKRSAWKNPTVQNELASYTRTFNEMGIAITQEELEQRVWNAAATWTAWMVVLRTPLRPYTDYAGVRQRWRMFVAPHRHPAKLHIDIKIDGQWRPVYVARSPDYNWRGHQLDHTRTRSMLFRYAWKAYRGSYRHFAKWIAAKATHDFPEASEVRVRWYGFRTPSPEEVNEDRVPKGKFRSTLVFTREALR